MDKDKSAEIQQLVAALGEHLHDVFLPRRYSEKILEEVKSGGDTQSLLNKIDLILMDFSTVVLDKKATLPDIVAKFKK
ncbi:hypothetical protein EXT57_05220 [Pectobacterium brasiliense]|uniref:hypothetical protein n=1 Tax=Pectobacterium brasiliense TaxID=180957 RepID=UPI00202D4870|nr:hypothetical protein [Pectobacterium brasiliense]MCL6376761.1 hypothetical protein [Pectobacterium brasiliense]